MKDTSTSKDMPLKTWVRTERDLVAEGRCGGAPSLCYSLERRKMIQKQIPDLQISNSDLS